MSVTQVSRCRQDLKTCPKMSQICFILVSMWAKLGQNLTSLRSACQYFLWTHKKRIKRFNITKVFRSVQNQALLIQQSVTSESIYSPTCLRRLRHWFLNFLSRGPLRLFLLSFVHLADPPPTHPSTKKAYNNKSKKKHYLRIQYSGVPNKHNGMLIYFGQKCRLVLLLF